jgi:hypothetical protein
LYFLQVLANSRKFIPPNHQQILPINPLNLYQINPRTNRQTNQPSKKQPRKFFMAIFGVTDQVPWWVGDTSAKGGHLRSVAVGGCRQCVQERQWLEVVEAEGVGEGRSIGRRREGGKVFGRKNEIFETTLIITLLLLF